MILRRNSIKKTLISRVFRVGVLKWAKLYLGASIYPTERVNRKLNRVNHPSKGMTFPRYTLAHF